MNSNLKEEGYSVESTPGNTNPASIGLILRGLSMGIAEVIPGVSGGTLAFITGIYEQLLDSIKAVDFTLIKKIFTGQFKSAWEQVNGKFLMYLLIGMFIGVIIGVFGVTYLLNQYPEVLWSLFFGCILASIPYMLSQISKVSLPAIAGFLIAAVLAGYICFLQPVQASDSPVYLIIAGSIAISALILPGVSGSFILVLLGLYTTVIPSIKGFLTTFDFKYFSIMFFFGLGCLIGLAAFSRILSYVFKRFTDITLAVLSGFMLGSLVKVWPWRTPTRVLDETTGAFRGVKPEELTREIFHHPTLKVVTERFDLPSAYFSDSYTLLCVIASLLGIGGIYLLSRIQKPKKQDRSK